MRTCPSSDAPSHLAPLEGALRGEESMPWRTLPQLQANFKMSTTGSSPSDSNFMMWKPDMDAMEPSYELIHTQMKTQEWDNSKIIHAHDCSPIKTSRYYRIYPWDTV